MNNTCIILLLFVALISCAFSSYLEIPPPPERPARFKTKEQIEAYLKAVKDYYDAFKLKLVRRENSLQDIDSFVDKATINNDENDYNDGIDYYLNQLPGNSYHRRQYRINRLNNKK